MDFRLNREIKHFCPNFRPIRKILRDIGAESLGRRKQVDYFYNLPRANDSLGTRRLKLRVERRSTYLVYYYDKHQSGLRTSRFQLFPVRDRSVKQVLDIALGVRTIVRKRREQWRKGNTLFNLDEVQDVGRIFEVEVQLDDRDDPDHQVSRYRTLFAPHLGDAITVSNEDLTPRQGDPSTPSLPG